MNDFQRDRWAEPVIPLAVMDEDTVFSTELGRPTYEFSARFKPRDIERFRTGYCCIKCWEPHPSPWPDQCSLCGFPMRTEQSEAFNELFMGVQRDPFAERIEAGLDRVDDTHERNFYTTNSGIVIPRGI